MKVDFFIVGAPKSGTTSLYNYLSQHHSITMSSVKEPNYFSALDIADQKLYYNTNLVSDLEAYNSLFNFKSNSCLFGEASVSYLFYQNVASRIHEYNKNAKIIIILRDPVKRAFSHYNMDKRLGFVKTSFENILDDISSKNHLLFYQQYIHLGFYYSQVKKYIDIFGKDKVCVMLHDDLKIDNAKFTNKILKFLNLDIDDKIDFNTPFNTYKSSNHKFINVLYSKSFVRKTISSLFPNSILKKINELFFRKKEISMSKDLEMKLYDLFYEDILLLEEMLEIDLSSWKR